MARILVVDDSPSTRALVSTVLVEEGHEIGAAPDGRRALEMIKQDPPDLLILDLMMPVMGGYELLQEIKRLGLRDSVKVLVLTGKASETEWAKGYRMGVDHYLGKPFDNDELTSAVRGLVNSSQAQIASHRSKERDRAQLLSRLDSIFGNR